MGLEMAKNIGAGILKNESQRLAVIGSNIQGSSVKGYTQKDAIMQPIIIDGMSAGAVVADIRRTVEEYIVREVNVQTSVLASAQTKQNFLNDIQNFFGTPQSESSLSAKLTEIENTLSKLSLNPKNITEQTQIVANVKDMVTSLNVLSSKIQSMRQIIEQHILTDVNIVSTELKALFDTNGAIKSAYIAGTPRGDLLDQRDNHLKAIAEKLDMKWYTREAGDVVVMLNENSENMLDYVYGSLSYRPQPMITAQSVYPGNIDGIWLDNNLNSSPPVDITNMIQGGSLKAYVDLRDVILPNLQSQIDQFTTKITEDINRVYNSGTSIPPIQTLVGSHDIAAANFTLLNGADLSSVLLSPDATSGLYGNFDIAIVNTTGLAVGTAVSVNMDQLHTDLQTLHTAAGGGAYQLTLRDIMNAVNGHYANITTAPAAVQPAGWTAAWPPVSNLANPIAGLGTQSGQAAPFAGNDGFMRIRNLKLEVGTANAAYGIAFNDVNSTLSYGNPARPSSLSYMFGLNDLLVIPSTSVSSSHDIQVRSDIVADPSLFSRGRLAYYANNNSWAVHSGDDAVVIDMTHVLTDPRTFSSIGGLGASFITFSQYADSVLAYSAKANQLNQIDLDFQDFLSTELQFKADQISGVNIDEQFVHLIEVQKSYSAGAHLIRTVQELEKELVTSIR